MHALVFGGGGGDCDFLDYFSKLWRDVENRIYQERLNFYLSFRLFKQC